MVSCEHCAKFDGKLQLQMPLFERCLTFLSCATSLTETIVLVINCYRKEKKSHKYRVNTRLINCVHVGEMAITGLSHAYKFPFQNCWEALITDLPTSCLVWPYNCHGTLPTLTLTTAQYGSPYNSPQFEAWWCQFTYQHTSLRGAFPWPLHTLLKPSLLKLQKE